MEVQCIIAESNEWQQFEPERRFKFQDLRIRTEQRVGAGHRRGSLQLQRRQLVRARGQSKWQHFNEGRDQEGQRLVPGKEKMF